MINNKVFLNEKVAKKLFKNDKEGRILSAMVISEIIGADYNEVFDNIKLSSEELAFSALTVNSTADVIYHDDATYFNIELNFYNIKSKSRQLESYVYQIYLGQLHTYHNYHDIKKIVQISIDAYDFFDKDEFMYKFLLMEEKYHFAYNDLIQIIHYNLAHLRNMSYNDVVKNNNKVMKALYFLVCNDDEKLDVVYERDDLMKEVINGAKQIAGIEKMNLYLTDEEMMKQDEEFFRKEGRKEEKREMIINLYNNGVSLDIISNSSGLSIDEVQKIINDSNK